MKHRKAAKSQAQPPTTPTATEPKATESAAAKTPDQTVAGWFIQMTSVDNAGFCNFTYFP